MPDNLAHYGWMAGDFIGMRCRDCQQEQVGHSRHAIRCEQCAIAASGAAMAEALHPSTRPRDILERLQDWPSLSTGLARLHADAVVAIKSHLAEILRLRAEVAAHQAQAIA
jgi:hypothetical protein